MPPAKRAAAKKAAPAPKKRAARPPIAVPKPPAAEPAPVEPQEGPAPVSDENPTPDENDGDDKPKRGRKPNVVGQANARFQKARANLTRWEKRKAKIQNIDDELAKAREEFEAAKEEYEAAFRASLTNTPAADDSDEDDGDDDE